MNRHTLLIFLAMLMIIAGLAMISLAAPIFSWIITFTIAGVLLLASLFQQRGRVNQ